MKGIALIGNEGPDQINRQRSYTKCFLAMVAETEHQNHDKKSKSDSDRIGILSWMIPRDIDQSRTQSVPPRHRGPIGGLQDESLE